MFRPIQGRRASTFRRTNHHDGQRGSPSAKCWFWSCNAVCRLFAWTPPCPNRVALTWINRSKSLKHLPKRIAFYHSQCSPTQGGSILCRVAPACPTLALNLLTLDIGIPRTRGRKSTNRGWVRTSSHPLLPFPAPSKGFTAHSHLRTRCGKQHFHIKPVDLSKSVQQQNSQIRFPCFHPLQMTRRNAQFFCGLFLGQQGRLSKLSQPGSKFCLKDRDSRVTAERRPWIVSVLGSRTGCRHRSKLRPE